MPRLTKIPETLLDLLELYTHYRTSTAIGPDFAVDIFLEVRIPLNAENLPRFTEYHESSTSHLPQNSHTIHSGAANGRLTNGKPSPKDVSPRDSIVPSPASQGSGGPTSAANGSRTRVGERGREGTVRFMLNPGRERAEKEVVAEYLEAG